MKHIEMDSLKRTNKRVFLVDLENINDKAFKGIEKLKKDDEVIIFFSPNQKTLNISYLSTFSRLGVNVQYENIFLDGKDSLDRQLIAYLGMKVAIETNPNTEFIIIAEDKGYSSVLMYLMKFNKLVYQSYNFAFELLFYINGDNELKTSVLGESLKIVDKEINNLIEQKVVTEDKKELLLRLVLQSSNKEKLSRALIGFTDSKRNVNIIYKAIIEIIIFED